MRVGTSSSLHSFIRAIKDHPHACGDKKGQEEKQMNKVGSSPCVWGQAYLGYVWHPQIRIIPMRVGTSKHVCYYQLTAQDHPHACGDKRPKRFIVSVGGGSSPCVWGQAANPTAYIILMRIIPMRVGTSTA